MRRMGRLKVGPALEQLSMRNAPNDDVAKLNSLTIRCVSGTPGIADDNFVSFGNDVFDRDMNVGKPLEGRCKITLGAFRAGGIISWHIASVFLVLTSKVPIGDIQ